MFSSKLCVALLALGAAAKHDLNENEMYLQPYLDDLADYRESDVGKRYIKLANLLDVPPTFLVDLFIPLLFPGSTLTVPVNKEIDLKIPVVGIPLGSFTLVNVTLKDLNEFKKLLPLKLLRKGKFSWRSQIEMRKLDIEVATKWHFMGKEVSVNIAMPLQNPSIDLTAVVAFDRTKLCSVWGEVMTSSLECAVWPLSNYENDTVSGVNVTALTMSISDFDFQLDVHGLGINNTVLQEKLEEALELLKPALLSNLPGNISDAIRSFANDAFLHKIPQFQHESPCEADPQLAPSAVINVSRVCISNNAAFILKWLSHDCPAHLMSSSTRGFAAGQSRCMDMTEAFPNAVEGDILRIQTHAVAGVHSIIEPALRYVPDSNAAGFECSGFTWNYHCEQISLVPVDPSGMPQVSQICVMNHALFTMWFEVENQRTGNWSNRTGSYLINQKRCINLADVDGVMEGDEFKPKVHAILGRAKYADTDIIFSNSGMTALYECKGTTLFYRCKLLVGLEGDETTLPLIV